MIFIRGAVTADENSREEILGDTKMMLETIIKKNHIKPQDILSIQFTATRDLDAVYPAEAAREMGITSAALMCLQEMYVKNSLEKCVRCEVFCESGKKQADAVHVYLKEAGKLRPDLKQKGGN